MRTRFGRFLLTALLLTVFLAGEVRGQVGPSLAPPAYELPIPLGGPRFRQDGTGIFFAAEFLFLEQTIPIESQPVAFRGFVDVDGSIGGTPGRFIGSGAEALNTRQLDGPDSFQPGLALAAGWRFSSGTIFEIGWWHLTDARYSATASVIPPNFTVGTQLADTFLTSPNFNFSTEFIGAAQNVVLGNPGATPGIWNAASEMTIDFVQRFDMGYANFQIPIDVSEDYRIYGTVGAKALIMWERFRWRTVGRDVNGQAPPTSVAIYSNVVSNRLYGATIGFTYDWFWGDSPLGSFALTASLEGSLMIDIVKERAKYELGDFSTAASRAINEYTLAPVVYGDISLWWFPYEAVQCRIGYNILAAFNTIAADQPIDFNVGAVSPNWQRGQIRILNGLHFGVGFLF